MEMTPVKLALLGSLPSSN